MPVEDLTYKGKKIEADTGDPVFLKIDGASLEVQRDPASGKFWMWAMPYARFDSLTDLAKAAIDQEEPTHG